MANISAIKLPNNSLYNVKDNSGSLSNHNHVFADVLPMESKTFTNVIGTENNWAGATFFFGSIKPTSWYAIWKIKYKIRVYVPGKNGYDQTAEVMLSGYQDTLRSYSSMNVVSSYYPAYYHVLYRLKSAGLTNGYGHSLGVRFYSAYEPTNTDFKRTIEVDVLECENCTFTFYNNCMKYAEIPGTGSTNYTAYTEIDFVSSGLQETGDNNDRNYENRIYYSSSVVAEQLYRYHLVLRTKDKKILPVSSANNTFTIGKTYSSTPFDPFGEIYYYYSSSSRSPNEAIGNATLYRQVSADLRYSFDLNASNDYKLVARQPVYLTATLQSDGSAILTKPSGSVIGPLAQTLPSSNDGLIYIYLGQAYEDTYPYRVELSLDHPVYKYVNGAVRQIFPDSLTVNGHTVDANVPSNAKFTDTVTTATTTGSGNAVTAISASNGALTVTKGTTFLTSHQDISGKADKSATVSTVAYDTTNKKITKTINGTTSDVVTVAKLKTDLGSMPASDVYSWAKASSKPSYTYSEITGTVPTSALPSYVDDVLEYSSKSNFPSTGETGKIYVDTSTNLTWRWGGSSYAEISPSLALGETSATAYRGDRGKTAYDHSQSTHARTDATAVAASSTNGNIKINGTETTVYTHPSGTNPHGTTKSDVGLGNVGNFKAVSTVASQGLTDTEKSNARANIGAGTSSLTLGTGSGNAYRGDYGNTAYTHATDANRLTTAKDSALYKIATTAHGHVKSVTAVAKSDITALGIPSENTWRGIQDNLTSATNTTESLSAKQGYLLANGSARDDTKLPLAGGKMSGNIELNSASGNSPAILFTRDGGNTDWKVFVTSGKLSFLSGTDASTFTERAYFKDNSGDFVANSFTGSGSALTSLNASNISSGTLAAARLPSSGATAGSYGDSSAQTPAYGGTFKVPYITVDTYGRVTGISEHTVKIPASDNTWRGIQDNLTSSSNTTESLSAKQGYLLANGSARDSTKLPLAGGTMTGTINLAENNVGWNFRASNTGYYTTASYQTSGNEALVFATKQAVTSFMFVNGEDSVANHSSDRWTSLTPGLQVKNNKVSIGKRIGNNVTPTYDLDVNGTANATDFSINAKATIQYDTTYDCINFVFN